MARKHYYKRPDGLFETSRTINGKRVVFRARTEREVDQKILAYQEDRERGRPFPVVADEWFASRDGDLAQSSWRAYNIALERIKAAFPQRIGEIKPLDLARYIKRFEARGYAGATVNTELTVIKQIFHHAVIGSGDIDVSPAAELRKSKGLPKKKRDALTPEQERAVEEYRGENWLLGVMLLYTGCRRGELLALDWRDVDRREGVIHVNKKITYAYGNPPRLEDHLKNRKPHDVPIFDALRRALPSNRVGKIFTGADGNYLTSSQFTRLWREYCAAVGLEGVTPHCFRHSFATICFEAGIDAESTAAFMGDTVEVVSRVYTDLRDGKRVSDAAQVNAYLEQRRAARG